MDQQLVDGILEKLHQAGGGPVVAYGKQIKVTEHQIRYLVTLNVLFPDLFLAALSAIEQGQCKTAVIKNDARPPGTKPQLLLVGLEYVDPELMCCTCETFANKLERNLALADLPKWDGICEHLLAAYLLQQNYEFLPDATQIELSFNELTELALGDPHTTLRTILHNRHGSDRRTET